MQIRPYGQAHLADVVRLSLRAWAPVFESIKKHMDIELYQESYPNGWKESQQKAVEDVCCAEDMNVWVAIEGESVIGFTAIKLDEEESLGEIYMIAVDPDAQGAGTGIALTYFALDWMKDKGMSTAMVETGCDPGHAPARHVYEKAGFRNWPTARYFKNL